MWQISKVGIPHQMLDLSIKKKAKASPSPRMSQLYTTLTPVQEPRCKECSSESRKGGGYFLRASTRAARLILFVVVGEFYLTGEIIVHVCLGFLCEGVLGYCLEGLLDVNGFLGARLEVRDAVLAAAPVLCPFG